MRAWPANAVLALSALALGCSRPMPAEHASDAGESRVDASVGGEQTDGAPPLAGYPELLELKDGDERLGFVSVPLGAREPRPVVIAIHGGSERPEKACAAWRGVTDAYAFVVCPRGFGGRDTSLGWRTTADTSQRIARALGATEKIFGAFIRETTTHVLVGFSMGGSQVALLARSDPRRYPRIVVGDSAHDPRPALTFSGAWAEGGGERAVFLCTTSGCEPSMRKAARNVSSHGRPARLVVAPTQVHGLSELAVQSMRREWPWLVEHTDGWAGYSRADADVMPGRTEAFEPN